MIIFWDSWKTLEKPGRSVGYPTLLENESLESTDALEMRFQGIPRRVANLQKAEHEEQCSSTMLMDGC